MNNLVSVRLNNKYEKSFSISHNYKTCHKSLEKRIESYYNLIHNNLETEEIKIYENICEEWSYFKQYEIIKKLNVMNYQIINDKKFYFRRDLLQELKLLELSFKEAKTEEEKSKIKDLIKSTKEEQKKYDYQYFLINNSITNEIEKIKIDHEKIKNRKLRKDRQLNFQGVITFGNKNSDLTREEMNNLNQDELDKNRNNLIKGILKKLDIPDRTYYLVKHLDEQQIHYHYEFVGYNKKENELIRRLVSQKFLIEIQDLAGEAFKSSNFERGNRKSERVREHCENNNINYKELLPKEKYLLLKKTNVKHSTLKEYNNKLNNDLELKKQDLNKQKERLNRLEIENKKQTKTLEKTIKLNELMERVENGTITIQKIQELKEKWKNDTQITRVLNNRQRRLNNKNEFEKYSKNLENLKSNIEKLTEEQKNKEIKIQELKENISEMSEQELKKRINKKEIEQIDEQIKSVKKQGGASEMADLINKKEAKKSDIDYK